MSVNGCASALWHHGLRPRHSLRPRRLVLLIAAAVTVALLGGIHAPMARAASSPTTPIWSTQLDFDNNGTPWSESFFAGLASDGLTTAELNMPWGTIEPQAGTFTFAEWDTELANASAAGIQLIPIFWQAGWGGSPAPWINDFEVGSGGAQGQQPAWWDPTEQSEYFTYVTGTIQNAIAQPGGYGGAILDYGFLDAQWDLGGAGGGYAAGDISEFQNTYLPQTYGTIATFNSDYGTSYSAFSQVPAAAPGQALFGVFQAFRAWSVQQTYGQLTADVRNVTASTPLYYYYGGGFGSSYQGFVASNVTDGNTSSYWESTDGAGYPQTITVNLGSVQSVGSLTLDLPPSSAWNTRTETLSVLGSASGSTFTQVLASAGYTFNPSTGNTATISLPSGTSAQYVRLSFTANTGWSAAQLSEFEIFP